MTWHEEVARAALARVYEPALVGALRADSPLPGYRSADGIAIAVAVAEEGKTRDGAVVLSDAEMVSIHTLGDLVREIASHSAGEGDE